MFALLCSTTFVFAANTDDVTTILTKVRDRYDGKDYISDVTLKIYDNNNYQ